jgi:hypothetical protein
MFEDLPLPLLRLVAFTLLPPPVPEAAEERDGEVGEHGEAVEAPLDEVESHPPAEKENNEAAPEAAVVGEDVKAVEAPAESGGIVDRQSFGELSQKAEEAWRRPSALDIDIDWEPEPSHWPQVTLPRPRVGLGAPSISSRLATHLNRDLPSKSKLRHPKESHESTQRDPSADGTTCRTRRGRIWWRC